MPAPQLDPNLKAIAASLKTRVENNRTADLKATLRPLRDVFLEAKESGINSRLMADDIIAHHPKFKATPVTRIVALIDEIMAEKPGSRGTGDEEPPRKARAGGGGGKP